MKDTKTNELEDDSEDKINDDDLNEDGEVINKADGDPIQMAMDMILHSVGWGDEYKCNPTSYLKWLST